MHSSAGSRRTRNDDEIDEHSIPFRSHAILMNLSPVYAQQLVL